MKTTRNLAAGARVTARDPKDGARKAIERYLCSLDTLRSDGQGGQGPTWHQPRPDQWTISAMGSHSQYINVELSLGEYTLQLVSFFMRRPDENLAAVYHVLLRRNLELSTVKFGADDFGDLFLRADLPVAGLTEDMLDRAVGIFYATADQNWEPVMRLGFAGSFKTDK